MAQDNELFQVVGGGHPHPVLLGDLVGGPLDIGIGRLRLLGIDHVDIFVPLHGAGVPLHLVGVEHQDHHALFEPLIVAEDIHEHMPGGLQVPLRHLLELLPGEDHVVAVHQQVLRALPPGRHRPALGALAAGGLGRGLHRQAPLHRAVGPLKDGLQGGLLLPGGGGRGIMPSYDEDRRPIKPTVFVLQSKMMYLSANGEKQFINNILPKLAAAAEEKDLIFIFTDVQKITDQETNNFFNNSLSCVFLLDNIAEFAGERGQKTVFGSMDIKNLKEEYAAAKKAMGIIMI